MRYLALCTDYDGTLATDGRVFPETVAALERLLASGRRLVLVTGRELDDLKKVCPRLDLFEYVVAENGALLYHPASGQETPLAPRPPETFVALLRQRGVGPISVGRVIVATWEPHESLVLATIRDLGLELQVIFNKGAVMILPAGVNKATGLARALERMELSARNTVGIGDAENDHALLASCECSAAVANALPTLKGAADIVTKGDHGAGVVELIDELLRDDLASREPKLTRHHILLGTDQSGREVHVSPHGETVLVVGPTHSGKSELATGLLERLALKGYTFGVIDVEGNYGAIAKAVALGNATRPPTASEILQLLGSVDKSGVVNLSGLPTAERLPFVRTLVPQLARLRARSGHPHWIVLDETRPARVAPQVLQATSLFIALGTTAPAALDEFCQVSGRARPETRVTLEEGAAGPRVLRALAWRPAEPNARPFRLDTATPQHPPSAGPGGVVKAAAQGANPSTRGLH